jgi:hypothetical protein
VSAADEPVRGAIPAARLEALAFQVEHKGITVHRFDAMAKAGTPMPEHACMIAVTPGELRQLLDAYREREQRA